MLGTFIPAECRNDLHESHSIGAKCNSETSEGDDAAKLLSLVSSANELHLVSIWQQI